MRLAFTRNGDLPIRRKVRQTLLHEAQARAPKEACGILLGRFGRIWTAQPATNTHPTPHTHFEIAPQALIDAHRAEREGGLQVLGYYHSHPGGEPYPSETDRAQSARDGKIWAIIGSDRVMFWHDTEEGFVALSYEITAR